MIPEGKRMGCDLCGLWRMCFLGRLANTSERMRRGLRIRSLRIARGMTLYRSGDRVESLYMVRSGCIKELDDTGGGHGSVINFSFPGEMLSLQCLGVPVSKTTGVAVEPSFICAVPLGAFSQMCATSAAATIELTRLIAKAGAAARDSLTLIRDKEAHERVAGFLLNVCGRLQLRGARGRELRLGMNRDDIADYLGLRSETVSRCFSELARRQLIKVRAKRVEIVQMAELRRVFHGGAHAERRPAD
jgi:CRP/FNR family transcriptional regulator